MRTTAQGYGATDAEAQMAPITFERRALRDDVAIAIDYCGVCHSDFNQARNDWGKEQMCRRHPTPAHNRQDRIDGSPTFGCYSDHVVVKCDFVLTLRDALDPARAAPLLCVGMAPIGKVA